MLILKLYCTDCFANCVAYAIYSNNDPISSLKELEYYADKFNAQKVFIPNVGHLGPKSGITKLPEALEIIKKHIIKSCK